MVYFTKWRSVGIIDACQGSRATIRHVDLGVYLYSFPPYGLLLWAVAPTCRQSHHRSPSDAIFFWTSTCCNEANSVDDKECLTLAQRRSATLVLWGLVRRLAWTLGNCFALEKPKGILFN